MTAGGVSGSNRALEACPPGLAGCRCSHIPPRFAVFLIAGREFPDTLPATFTPSQVQSHETIFNRSVATGDSPRNSGKWPKPGPWTAGTIEPGGLHGDDPCPDCGRGTCGRSGHGGHAARGVPTFCACPNRAAAVEGGAGIRFRPICRARARGNDRWRPPARERGCSRSACPRRGRTGIGRPSFRPR